MSRFATIALTMTGFLLTAVGCSTQPSEPPPPPPPPPDNTRNLAIETGDDQRTAAGQPVAIAPSVRVTNSAGGGVSGVPVTFAVASGNGVVTGANPTTDANGVATVGRWTLGPDLGPNTLTATAANGTNGPVTFTATAIELVLVPSKDTVLSGGMLMAKRVDIPAGVTVTVGSPLTLEVDSVAEIRGTLRGACLDMTVDAKQGLLLQGTIDNGCAIPQDDPPPMLLVGRTGYEVDGGTIVTSGDFEITNDPDLTEAEVPGPVAPASGLAPGVSNSARSLVIGGCRLTAGRLSAGGKARMGTPGKTGGSGGNGRRLWVSCRGNATVGAMTIEAQDGGDGGKGTDLTVNAVAKGGPGGRGGEIRFLSTGSLTFDDRATIVTGDGGNGGPAEAIPAQPGSGLKASNAKATGGRGGEPGLFRVKAAGQIVFPVNTSQSFTIGKAGDGGDAKAIGANGNNAGAQRAQAGGDGDAEGGPGASTPDKRLQGAGTVGGGRATLDGGNAGKGGNADGSGGRGGNGNQQFIDGANGGDIRGQGGKGGDALLRDFNDRQVGDGGNGGDAVLRQGVGGNGAGSCNIPLAPGGKGGEGGDGSGGAGKGGANGGNPAPSLSIRIGGGTLALGAAGQDGHTEVRDETGNGGNGADGAGPGLRGTKGGDGVSALNRTDVGKVFANGSRGKGCVFNTQFAVKSDPQGHDNVLDLSPSAHPVRVTKLGTSIIVEFLDFAAGTASGGQHSSGGYVASGTFQISTSVGTRSGSMTVMIDCDEVNGTITGTVRMSGLPGGDVIYDIAGTVGP